MHAELLLGNLLNKSFHMEDHKEIDFEETRAEFTQNDVSWC